MKKQSKPQPTKINLSDYLSASQRLNAYTIPFLITECSPKKDSIL